jgi:hypothetical protein
MEKRVIDDPKFNKDFPEDYDWLRNMNQISLDEIVCEIVFLIKQECAMPVSERNRMPGLKAALIIVSKYARLMDTF